MIGHPTHAALLWFDRADRDASPRRRDRIAAHLRACVRCRARLTDLRRIRELAGELGDAAPAAGTLDAILERVRAGDSLILPVPASAETMAGGAHGTRWTGWVAALALLVCVGSAAGAVVAGRPLLRWVQERVVGSPSTPVTQEPTPPEPLAGVEVAISPSGMIVELVDAGADLIIVVTSTDGTLLEVLGVGEAALARFGSGDGSVVVTGAARGTLRLGVPRSGAPLRVTASGRELLSFDPAGADTPLEMRLGDALGLQSSVR